MGQDFPILSRSLTDTVEVQYSRVSSKYCWSISASSCSSQPLRYGRTGMGLRAYIVLNPIKLLQINWQLMSGHWGV